MANKEFKIQSDTISLNGVPLSSSVDGKVVIPGVTRATNFRADEVEDRDDDDFQYTQTIAVVDYIVYQELLNETGDGSGRADYITELDEDGKIDDIEVGGGGTYTAEESTLNANNDMYAYIGTGSASDRPIVPEDWRQIPFRPKMKANSVESEFEGGGGPGLGDFTIDGNTLQSSTVNVRGNSGVNIKTQNPSNPLQTRDWNFTPTGRLVFPDGSQQTTAYTGGGGQPVINNTVKGFINLVGDKPNDNDDIWFESLVVVDGYAFTVGKDYYINNDGPKVYKFDINTGEQIWVKQIDAGRNARFNLLVGEGQVVVDSISNAGVGYKEGDEIVITGWQIGGSQPQNNVILVVDTVDGTGGVLTASVKPGYDIGAANGTFNDVQSDFNNGFGDACAISYDYFAGTLLVVTEFTTGQGDPTFDSVWTWSNVYSMDPDTGEIISTTTLSDGGDVYANSIAVWDGEDKIAIAGEKYDEYRDFGELTLLAGGNGYFDVLKSEIDEEHYPGAPFDWYGDFWVTGTGILTQENVDGVNYYTQLPSTVQQGSGSQVAIGEDGAGNYTLVGITAGGVNYLPGHILRVPGTDLGGTTPENDALLQIITVDGGGAILTTGISGTAFATAPVGGWIVSPVNYNTGSGATFYTQFNNGITEFYVDAVGSNYVIGDILTIAGTNFANGTSPTNDVEIEVVNVDGQGGIVAMQVTVDDIPTNALRIRVDGIDFSGPGTWSMRQNLGAEAFVWTPAWNKAIGGPSGERFYDVAWSSDGNSLYAVGRGRYETNYDQALVVKFAVSETAEDVVNVDLTTSSTGSGTYNDVSCTLIFVNGNHTDKIGYILQQSGDGITNWTTIGSPIIHAVYGDFGPTVTTLYIPPNGLNITWGYSTRLVLEGVSAGDILWSKDIKFLEADTNNREARAVSEISGSSDIMVAGVWYNGNVGTDELILTRITDAGSAVWQKTYSFGAYENNFGFNYTLSLKSTNSGMVVSFEQNSYNSDGLAYVIIDPTDGSVIRHRIFSSDGNSNNNNYDTPTPNFADIYVDGEDDYIVFAGNTYVPTDNYSNALLMKLPLDGVKNIEVGERLSIGEHIMNRYDVFVTTVTPAFESFTPFEHNNAITNLSDIRNFASRDPDGVLQVWTTKVTDDAAGFVEFGDGSRQSFATNVIPQVPAANDYYLTEQDSGKHIYFENENGRVYIPHRDTRYFPVGFTFTIVNTTGSNCYVETESGDSQRARLKLAGRNIDTWAIYIPDSGSGSMVTFLKIKDGYTMANSDGDGDEPDVWIVSGPGDIGDDS